MSVAAKDFEMSPLQFLQLLNKIWHYTLKNRFLYKTNCYFTCHIYTNSIKLRYNVSGM